VYVMWFHKGLMLATFVFLQDSILLSHMKQR